MKPNKADILYQAITNGKTVTQKFADKHDIKNLSAHVSYLRHHDLLSIECVKVRSGNTKVAGYRLA